MICLISFGVTVQEIFRVEISEKLLNQQKVTKSCIFKGSHFANGSSKPNNPQHFL